MPSSALATHLLNIINANKRAWSDLSSFACIHGTHTASAFAVLRFSMNPDLKKHFFFLHDGMATLLLYWLYGPFYRIYASYTQNLESLVRKQTSDFEWKSIEKENPTANGFFQAAYNSSSCFFPLLIFCFLVLSFPNATSALFVSIWLAGDLFVCKASPHIMQLLWLLTYLNSSIWSGLHSFIWVDFHDMDLNDPPVATFSVFAFLALFY